MASKFIELSVTDFNHSKKIFVNVDNINQIKDNGGSGAVLVFGDNVNVAVLETYEIVKGLIEGSPKKKNES